MDFIADCRLGKAHNYDIVEDPMANDTVFNSDLFYQNREYIAICYKEGNVLM